MKKCMSAIYLLLLSMPIILTSCKKQDVDNNSKISYGSVADIEGNVYKTVTIGSQTWMAENLKVKYYRNGDLIKTSGSTGDTCSKYQWVYENSDFNLDVYGRLYTWNAIMDNRNVCPIGWHIPTDSEWDELINYLGGDSIARTLLMEAGSSHWAIENSGKDINASGFTAIPGGYFDGLFNGIKFSGYWWSSSETDPLCALCRYIKYNDKFVYKQTSYKKLGYSVRCIKD